MWDPPEEKHINMYISLQRADFTHFTICIIKGPNTKLFIKQKGKMKMYSSKVRKKAWDEFQLNGSTSLWALRKHWIEAVFNLRIISRDHADRWKHFALILAEFLRTITINATNSNLFLPLQSVFEIMKYCSRTVTRKGVRARKSPQIV